MKKFKEEVNKLNQIVNDNEIGFATWWGCLDQSLQNIFKMYYGYSPSDVKPTEKCSLSEP